MPPKEGLEEPLLGQLAASQTDEGISAAPRSGVGTSAHPDQGQETSTSGEAGGDAELGSSPESVEEKGHSMVLTGWGVTTCILLADMFGLGALTLPADYARLGWLGGVGVTCLATLGMVYTGVLFTRLAANLPRTGRFDDYGTAAFGRKGRLAVYLMVYLPVWGAPVVFQLTCVECLKQIFSLLLPTAKWAASNVVLGLGVAAAMWPLGQSHALEELWIVSMLGTLGMLVAILVVVGKCLALPGPSPPTRLVEDSSLKHSLVATMDIMFAFGGQINWMRYLSVMKYPTHFTRTVNIAAAFMGSAFLAVGAVAYAKLGTEFNHTQPITSVFPQDAWMLVANVGVLMHCVGAYQVNLNVWTAMVLHFVSPDAVLHPARIKSRAAWGMAATAGLAYSFLVAFLLPFFSTVLSLIGAIGDVGGSYLLPMLFNLALFKSSMPRWEVRLCTVLVPVAGVMTVLGVVASVLQLVEDYHGGGGGGNAGVGAAVQGALAMLRSRV